MRIIPPLLAVLCLLAAAGCSRGESVQLRGVSLSLRPAASARSAVEVAGLAPSRDPAADRQREAEARLVGGLDWGMWGPFPEDATIPVDVIAFGSGCIFYVPGFAVGAVVSVVTIPVLGISTFFWLPGDCGSITGSAGYYLLGIPFYAVQKIVWDGPCAFGRFLSLHCRSYKGQVDWLVPRVDDSPYGRDVYRKLKSLTGEDFGSREKWTEWWTAHRDEFDSDMERAAPAAPAPTPTPGS